MILSVHTQAQAHTIMDATKKDTLCLLAYYLLCNNKMHKAEALYKVLARKFPEDGQIAMSLAYIYELTSRHEQALEQVNKSMKQAGEEHAPLALLLKARVLRQLDRPEEAQRNVERYLRALDRRRQDAQSAS